MEFITVIILSVLNEGIVEIIKTFYKNEFINSRISKLRCKDALFFMQSVVTRSLAIAVGIFLCYITYIDILTMLNLYKEPDWPGVVITGVLISRGSNYLHILIKKLDSGL